MRYLKQSHGQKEKLNKAEAISEEIMSQNFPKVMKGIDSQFQGGH